MQPSQPADRFRDGTPWQKALFALLVGVYLLGIGIAADDKVERLGQPDVGFSAQGRSLSPTRADAAALGLRGGGLALELNGRRVEGSVYAHGTDLRTVLGETNTLVVRKPSGETRTIEIDVRALTPGDVVYAEGALLLLGAVFFVVGLIAFMLRPYTPPAWSLAATCMLGGALASNSVLAPRPDEVFQLSFLEGGTAFLSWIGFHLGLTFPVVHPILSRRRWIVPSLYGAAALDTSLNLFARSQGFGWVWGSVELLDATVNVAALLFFAGRSLWLAIGTRDPLVAQRARIVSLGLIFGVGPPVLLNFARGLFGDLAIDPRIVFWSLSIFVGAMGWLTLRHDLMNARLAMRRAVAYGLAVGVLTAFAMALVTVRPILVALLIMPLLYWWPSFNDRLNQWLYPKRRRFSGIIRALGEELGSAATADTALDVLASAPSRIADARSATAVLFEGVTDTEEHVRSWGVTPERDGHRIEDESLVHILATTRKEILRSSIAVEPQYSEILDESLLTFDRLDAEVILPIVRNTNVVGVLALGPRTMGDVYDRFELDVLMTIAQQTVQAIARIGATERLRERELEFADLKRFFPQQIIDQIMARGGASELRSQRKIVTVCFVDLRGFTTFSEQVEPEEVMSTLNEYHTAMGKRIAEYGGTLERFAGDGFMVFFNDPVEQPDHVERAARMALSMKRDAAELHERWQRRGYSIHVGIGLHTGYATCGFIGYEGRRDYGVIGNVTNLAARLSDAANGGEILVTQRVQSELEGSFDTVAEGELELKGFQQPQKVFRLISQLD